MGSKLLQLPPAPPLFASPGQTSGLSTLAPALQYADHIMDALLNVSACRKSSVHEEAMLAVVSCRLAAVTLACRTPTALCACGQVAAVGIRTLTALCACGLKLSFLPCLAPLCHTPAGHASPKFAFCPTCALHPAGRDDLLVRPPVLQVHGALLPGAADGPGAAPGGWGSWVGLLAGTAWQRSVEVHLQEQSWAVGGRSCKPPTPLRPLRHPAIALCRSGRCARSPWACWATCAAPLRSR